MAHWDPLSGLYTGVCPRVISITLVTAKVRMLLIVSQLLPGRADEGNLLKVKLFGLTTAEEARRELGRYQSIKLQTRTHH